MRWTPTSQEMPDNMRMLWVTVERKDAHSYTAEGWWDKDQWRIQSSIGYIPLAYNETVTAFMDIPTCPMPYKEDV